MTDAESGGQGKSPEFDFSLAEREVREIETLEAWLNSGEQRDESPASYKPYDYIEDNKITDSDPWTGQSNSSL